MASLAVSSLSEPRQCGSFSQNWPWYLIQSKPTQEEVAHSFLSDIGADLGAEFVLPFWPMAKNSKKRKPFFPRYLFGRFHPELYWMVNKAIGVHRIVHFGCNAAIVPDHVVEQIRRRMDCDSIIQIETAVPVAPKFHHGDSVKITDGPMRGFLGMFDYSISDGERVRILLNTIGQLPVVVGKHDLMLI